MNDCLLHVTGASCELRKMGFIGVVPQMIDWERFRCTGNGRVAGDAIETLRDSDAFPQTP